MKTAFLFGGSGYIGHYVLTRFMELDKFEAYVIYDLTYPRYSEKLSEKVKFIQCDVRHPIPAFEDKINASESWIFNLAAIHREPGHAAHEYYDTNINGAKNINAFAEFHKTSQHIMAYIARAAK